VPWRRCLTKTEEPDFDTCCRKEQSRALSSGNYRNQQEDSEVQFEHLGASILRPVTIGWLRSAASKLNCQLFAAALWCPMVKSMDNIEFLSVTSTCLCRKVEGFV